MLAPMPTRASKNVISLRRISRLPYFSRLRSLTWLRLDSQRTAFAKGGLGVRGEALDQCGRGLNRVDEAGVLAHQQRAAIGVTRGPGRTHRRKDFLPATAELPFAAEPLLDE